MTRAIPTLGLLVSVLAVLAALTPFAYASPPDPTWTSGFFDDDDNDNGVFFVTSSLAAIDPFPRLRWIPFPVRGPAVTSDPADPTASLHRSSPEARAPPLA